MAVFESDVHGVGSYKDRKGKHIMPTLFRLIEKGTHQYRILFWTRGSQKEGYDYLEKHQINTRQRVSFWDKLLPQKNEESIFDGFVRRANHYPCVGWDTLGECQRIQNSGDEKQIRKFLDSIGLSKKTVEEFCEDLNRWTESITKADEVYHKDPRIFGHRGEICVIMESDGAHVNGNGQIVRPNETLAAHAKIAEESDYSYLAIPESRLWSGKRKPAVDPERVFWAIFQKAQEINAKKPVIADIGADVRVYSESAIYDSVGSR